MASPVPSSCEMSTESYTISATSVTSAVEHVMSASDPVTSRMDDPVSVSFRLYSLIDTHDRAVEQAQAIDSYILSLTERIVRDARKDGHIGHGLLLLNRKCVAEGVHQVFLKLAARKRQQIRECYNYIRQYVDQDVDLTSTIHDVSHDHEVMQLARGLSRECCAFQRMC